MLISCFTIVVNVAASVPKKKRAEQDIPVLDDKAKAELRARVLDQLNSIFDLDVQEQATAFPPEVRYFFFFYLC